MEKFSDESHTDPRFRIGMRNIKTGLAVGLCLLFFQTIGFSDGIQASIAAIICMKSSLQNSVKTGIERMVGTAIGAVLGVSSLLLIERTDFRVATILAIIGVILIIYLCNILKVQASIVISLVVFLIILIGEKDTSPIVYGAMRLGETFFGIVVAYVVNRFFDVRHVKRLRRVEVENSNSPFAIREGHLSELPTIMALWLDSNISSHPFINPIYWHEIYDHIKMKIQVQADVFVYESDGKIVGFIALIGDCDIIALNVTPKTVKSEKEVSESAMSKAMASEAEEKLLLHCQDLYPCLNIKVFSGNEKRLEKLVHMNFFIEKEEFNSRASTEEISLSWSDKS